MKHTAKILLPWVLLLLGLATLIYPRFAGKPLFPVYSFGELTTYPVWQVPFVYIASYATRAWGPLLFAFMLGGIIAVFIPKEKMKKLMGSKRFLSYLIAGLAAPVMTVCSCAMIPLFGGILISGAGIGPAITYLLMAPAANLLALVFTANIISVKLMIFRFLFSFAGAVITGYLISLTQWGKYEERKFAFIEAVQVEDINHPFGTKSWRALKEAWILIKLVLPYLGAGIFVISLIERYLPPQLVVQYLTGARGIVLGAVIGVPTYTPTLVEVFLVKALISKGMSPASALAFLIGAPMASIPSMLGVSRIVNWKIVLSYAILAIGVAMAAGFAYETFIGTL